MPCPRAEYRQTFATYLSSLAHFSKLLLLLSLCQREKLCSRILWQTVDSASSSSCDLQLRKRASLYFHGAFTRGYVSTYTRSRDHNRSILPTLLSRDDGIKVYTTEFRSTLLPLLLCRCCRGHIFFFFHSLSYKIALEKSESQKVHSIRSACLLAPRLTGNFPSSKFLTMDAYTELIQYCWSG